MLQTGIEIELYPAKAVAEIRVATEAVATAAAPVATAAAATSVTIAARQLFQRPYRSRGPVVAR